MASFKHRLNRNLMLPYKYYNGGSRKEQDLQARLRLECSSLNSNLYRKHIVLSPSCQCGDFESAAHFLFNCPIYTIQYNTKLYWQLNILPCLWPTQYSNYTNERQTYLPDNLRTNTTKDLLFGCEMLQSKAIITLFTSSRLYC